MPKILMVCLGNICRSPLAEGIMNQKCKEAGFHWLVDSAGTGNWHIGEPPHVLSQKVASQHNIDISNQRARQLKPKDFETFDKIFFMDCSNLEDAKKIAGPYWDENKVALLLDCLEKPNAREVPDPYFGDFSGYLEVFNLISQACERIVKEFKTIYQPNIEIK